MGKERGKEESCYNSKKKAVLAIELFEKHQLKRLDIKTIDYYFAKSLTLMFEQHISKTSKILTDKWRGYQSLKQRIILSKNSVIIDKILKNYTW